MGKVFGFFLLLTCVAGAFAVRSQTIAQDWTRTDCSGVDYPGTNSPCGPCKAATTALTKLHAGYAVSHPGKVQHYMLAYSDNYSCDDIAHWEKQFGFDIPSITACASDLPYYHGMGAMPTI